MKKTTLISALLLLCLPHLLSAREGYHINLKMADMKDTMVYLVHYYGQARPHIFIADSAVFDKRGLAVFDCKKPDFVGGIYMILIKDKAQTNFEILLNKGDEISISALKSQLPDGITVKGSAENEGFKQYLEFVKRYAAEQKKLEEEYKSAITAADTASVRAKAVASAQARKKYTSDYAAAHRGTLPATVFNAMEVPEVPTGTHYLEDGTTKDSTYAYRYYKAHYWDGFNFKDDRLIYTPAI